MIKIRWSNDLETEYCYWQDEMRYAETLGLQQDVIEIKEALKAIAEKLSA